MTTPLRSLTPCHRWHRRACVARVASALALVMLSAASTAAAADTDALCLGDDFVAVARHHDFVALATSARAIARDRSIPYIGGSSGPQWRFRTIPTAFGTSLTAFRVNRRGDSAYVAGTAPTGSFALPDADLTQNVLAIGPDLRSRRPHADADKPQPCTMDATRLQNFDAQFLEAIAESTAGSPANVQGLTWEFFHIDADAALYAPEIHLAREELIAPESFHIWKEMEKDPASAALRSQLRADAKTGAQASRALKMVYLQYRAQHPNMPATVYTYRGSYPGSWLFEFWFYYPIDEGGLDEHVHDSEHFFVEVDKLGGAVRRVVGAAHGPYAPNNEYGTYNTTTWNISLPLSVLVEQGKHATAPDLDGDGRFVPGIDTNLYRDVGKVWGVRDATGATDSAFRSFEEAMMSARSDTVGVLKALHAGEDHCPNSSDARPSCYRLVELKLRATDETTEKCGKPTTECARTQVMRHEDFREPSAVLKGGYFPTFAVRFGYAATPTKAEKCPQVTAATSGTSVPSGTPPCRNLASEISHRVTAGISVEISSIPFGRGKRLPLSGRLGANLIIDPSTSDAEPGLSGVLDGFSLRYERTLTNLFGSYVGFTKSYDELGQGESDANKGEPNMANWLVGGISFEMPLNSRVNINVRYGGAYSNTFGLAQEVHASLGFAFGVGHRRFGIVKRAPNPYSR